MNFPAKTESRKDLVCMILLCLLCLATWIPRIAGPLDLRWDAGVYYILGSSLAEGKGYRLLSEPGEIQAIQYPPLLPAIVALEQKILHSHHPVTVGIALRRTYIVFSLLYICLTFLMARLFLPRFWAFLLSLLCLLNYDMYFLSTLCFAELPFVLFSTLFVYLYYRKGEGSLSRRFAPLAAIACYLLRTAGITLLAAWVLDALLRKQFRHAAIRVAVAAVPVFLWQSYVHRVESGYTYQHPYYSYQRDPSMFYNVSYARNMSLKSPFEPDLGYASSRDMMVRVLDNVWLMPGSLGNAAYSKRNFWTKHIVSINEKLKRFQLPVWPLDIFYNLIGFLVIGGILWACWKRQWLLSGILVFTVAAICTTPWPGQFSRYFSTIVPLVLLVLFQLLRNTPVLLQKVFPRLQELKVKRAIHVLLSIFVLQAVMDLITGNMNFLYKATYETADGVKKPYHVLHYLASFPSTEEALRWLMGRADPQSVLVLSMPHWAYLKTGLKAVMPPLTTNPQKAQAMLDSIPARYVLIDQLLGEDNFAQNFPATVRRFPDLWKQVYSSKNGDIVIFERTNLN